jgi:hypothetical protein
MKYRWADIEEALNKGSIESLDKTTLEALSCVEPEPSGNSAYHVRFAQAQFRIRSAIDRINAKEREEKELAMHNEIHDTLEGLKIPHWTVLPNFWVTVIAALAAILAVYFSWNTLPASTPQHQPLTSSQQSSSLQKK